MAAKQAPASHGAYGQGWEAAVALREKLLMFDQVGGKGQGKGATLFFVCLNPRAMWCGAHIFFLNSFPGPCPAPLSCAFIRMLTPP